MPSSCYFSLDILDASLYEEAKDLTIQMDDKFQDYCEENGLNPTNHELFQHVQQCLTAFQCLEDAMRAYNKRKERSYIKSATRKRKVSPVPLATVEPQVKMVTTSTMTVVRSCAVAVAPFSLTSGNLPRPNTVSQSEETESDEEPMSPVL